MVHKRNLSSSSSSARQATNSMRYHRHETPVQQPSPRAPTMSPTTRYNNNLKVLRRRDPSITSIFDQFSHVCVYHHNGEKWEKHGFEGSMFVYERDSYPPYGFYILNRQGMDDYIQRLHPEDDIEAHGNYLMLRSYPHYTSHRLASLSSTDKFDKIYAVDNLENITSADKGESTTIGLWMFATDSREPMIDVMLRLHSFIKKNIPYPEEFHYGPTRPPPPNPHLRSNSASSSRIATHNPSPTSARSEFGSGSTSEPHINGEMSIIDKLFAKYIPSKPDTPLLPSPPNPTIDNSLVGLGDKVVENGPTGPIEPAEIAKRSGLTLLNSMFASATPSPSILSTQTSVATIPPSDGPVPSFSSSPSAAPQQPTQTQTQAQAQAQPAPPIHSPMPTSTSLPQILNQDVISALMGFPSRSSSSSSKNRYDGDNEAGASNEESPSENDAGLEGNDNESPHESKGVHAGMLGDVTPKPTLRPELGLGSTKNRNEPSTISRGTHKPGPHSTSAQDVTSNHVSNSCSNNHENGPSVEGRSRPLVSFEADSELWPYPRAPLVEDDEIVEMDFEDTFALSDMDAFQRRLDRKAKEVLSKGKNKASGGKKTKKEKEAERQKEREEIEKSWDVPEPVSPPPAIAGSPLAIPAPVVVPVATKPARVINGKETAPSKGLPMVNGAGHKVEMDIARELLIDAVVPKLTKPGKLERRDFMQQMLTLIYTDQSFVEKLYQDYLSRGH